MLKNASLLAIVAVHTAENEPSEVGERCGRGAAQRDSRRALTEREGAPPSVASNSELDRMFCLTQT